MTMVDETIKDSGKISKILRDIADGADSGRITFVPGVSILETQWGKKSPQDNERVMNGYFRLSLVYYDKEQDDTKDDTKDPNVINLIVHDGTHGMKDNLGKG